MSPTAKVLVVANRTVDSPELIAALRQRAAHSPAGFTLLVPAVPRGLAWAADMKAGGPEAAPRAEVGARRMRMAGLEVEAAIVGDPDPLAAVGDALRAEEFDELVVSTLSRRRRRCARRRGCSIQSIREMGASGSCSAVPNRSVVQTGTAEQ